MGTILIVDDDDLSRFTLSEMVEELGHDVVACDSAEQALEVLIEQTVDFVLTDIVMPNMNGNELITHIRAKWPDVPVVAVSGSGRTVKHNYVEMAVKAGARAVLHKPFVLEDLKTIFDEHLGQSD